MAKTVPDIFDILSGFVLCDVMMPISPPFRVILLVFVSPSENVRAFPAFETAQPFFFLKAFFSGRAKSGRNRVEGKGERAISEIFDHSLPSFLLRSRKRRKEWCPFVSLTTFFSLHPMFSKFPVLQKSQINLQPRNFFSVQDGKLSWTKRPSRVD